MKKEPQLQFRKFVLSVALFAMLGAGAVASNAIDQRDGSNGLRAIVDSYATAHGLPREFARAIVRVESSWNPELTGAAGEVGLMQIKFDTARYIGYEGTREQLYEPAINVRWGMKYLAGAWELGGGDHCQTVLRYQGGHGAKAMTNAARTYCDRLRRFMAAAN